MRNQTWNQQGGLIEDIEIVRIGESVSVKDHLAGTTRPASAEETEELMLEEKSEKVSQAKERAITAILASRGASPWGTILYDLAVGQGWIEAE